MARKKKHEEHVNAEAWAIPYGDLVTLLFALFTVMYAVSSVNEGKFRVLSDSMIAAFHGEPKSIQPVNVGEKQSGNGGDKPLVGVLPTALMKIRPTGAHEDGQPPQTIAAKEVDRPSEAPDSLVRMEAAVKGSMKPLIDAGVVSVRRENDWLEIEINTDLLFPSGAAGFVSAAQPVVDKLAEVLKPFPNPIRVEGHTDDRPLHTAAYPSNWELSAARAASVVHQFTQVGVDPLRLEIVGFGEYHPRQPNATPEGRNANRRVAILVLQTLSPDDAKAAAKEHTEHEPEATAAGVEPSDGGSAANGAASRVEPAKGAAPAPTTVPATGTVGVPHP
jgi:chemotaxis protein MotB